MDVYNAIMRAADHIEDSPKSYEFGTSNKPECGTTGCMLGWIGFFLGVPKSERESYMGTICASLGLPSTNAHMPFTGRLFEITTPLRLFPSLYAKDVPQSLRLYAAKYHAPARRTDAELVADLMAKVNGARIPDEELTAAR